MVDQTRLRRWFTSIEIPGYPFRSDITRHPEPDAPIQLTSVAVVSDTDFVAQKSCGLGGRMRDQRLFIREFQLQLFSKKCCQSLLDFFGFAFRAGESEQKVVGISHIP
jgi:hypothetical protein